MDERENKVHADLLTSLTPSIDAISNMSHRIPLMAAQYCSWKLRQMVIDVFYTANQTWALIFACMLLFTVAKTNTHRDLLQWVNEQNKTHTHSVTRLT
jgi:hypothetical protein